MDQLAVTGRPYYILSLDGGGSLGVYTLGVLSEVEAMLGKPLHEVFDLIYGTSTGSIIGSMLALGDDVDSITTRYFEIVPKVVGRHRARSRSAALERWATTIYKSKGFDAFITNMGIVATHLEHNRPMVFKSHVDKEHGSSEGFQPGFGCSIGDAIVASCAASPMYAKKTLSMSHGEKRTMLDGWLSANNPSLFALADAVGPLEVERGRIRLLSLGTGVFPERKRLSTRFLPATTPTYSAMLHTSSNTVEMLRELLFPDVKTVRIDDVRTQIRYKTDFMESDVTKLRTIYEVGRESFAGHEGEIRALFEEGAL